MQGAWLLLLAPPCPGCTRRALVRVFPPSSPPHHRIILSLRLVLTLHRTMHTPGPQVRALSVEVLSLTSRSAPPAALRPLLPALVPPLLEALSSLEDSRCAYLSSLLATIVSDPLLAITAAYRLAGPMHCRDSMPTGQTSAIAVAHVAQARAGDGSVSGPQVHKDLTNTRAP